MNKISKILLTLTVLVMLTASASAQTLNLYAKYEQGPTYGPWDINACTNAPSGTLTYSLTGPATWSFTAEKLTPSTNYVLIYYADGWPGNNPGAVIATEASDEFGDLTMPTISAPGIDLPHLDDANYPLAGKIWLVTASDYDQANKKMLLWNPQNYLYESEGGLNYVVNASAAAVEITAGEVGVASAETYTLPYTLPITMDAGLSTVGSIQLEVDYSNFIVSETGGSISVASVSQGSGIGSSSFEYYDDTTNKIVTISIINSTGLTGSNLNIADIGFTIGAPDSPAFSILYGMSLTAEVTDNAGTPVELSSAVDNGYIWIESDVITEVVGDEDADGYVTAADALKYLKKAADSSYAGDFDDICGTSHPDITAWDALMVLQASTSGATLTAC